MFKNGIEPATKIIGAFLIVGFIIAFSVSCSLGFVTVFGNLGLSPVVMFIPLAIYMLFLIVATIANIVFIIIDMIIHGPQDYIDMFKETFTVEQATDNDWFFNKAA